MGWWSSSSPLFPKVIGKGGWYVSSKSVVFDDAKPFWTARRREATTTTTTTSKSGNKRGDVENDDDDDDDALFFEHVRLNRDIVACTTHGQILEHVELHSERYNGVNVSTAWHRLAKKLRRDEQKASMREFKRDARVLLLEEATVRCMRGLFRNENDGRSRELVSRRRNEKR